MAGKNTLLQPGEVLFKAGDASDGMYIIRRGELQVYLEQSGKQVALANINDGGIIGEMALFDQKPRSASVKATKETEVSQITSEDFGKLMKQIPKWFVTLMSSLSTRLRQTNERLQRLEGMSTQKTRPFMSINRLIHVLILLWHKGGEKEGREWTIEKDKTLSDIREMFDEDPVKLKSFLDIMAKYRIIIQKTGSYGNAVVLSLPNRGILERLNSFIVEYVKKCPTQPCLSDGAINMLKAFANAAKTSAYDTVSLSVAEIQTEGKKMNLETKDWQKEIGQVKYIGGDVAVVKTSDGSPGFKGQKKDLAILILFHEVMSELSKANLA